MISVIRRRIIPAAAAFTWNSFWGREIQLNIWIGITVKGSKSHLNEKKGKVDVTGEEGKNAMNVSAPTVMMGAVSPMALERPMIIPVKIPLIE